MPSWRKLEAEAEIPIFIDAAAALHKPLLDRLARGERPFFFDHWLTRFNHSDAWWLPETQGGPALVTAPRIADRHEYRWQVRTLAIGAGCRTDLDLPTDVGVERSFLMPRPCGEPSTNSVLSPMTAEPVQLGYVVRIDNDDGAAAEPGEWRFHESAQEHVGPILALLERAYPWLDEALSQAPIGSPQRYEVDPTDLHRQREELRQLAEYGAGWCFHATREDDSAPIAMVSYLAMPLPLVGAPSALAGDLAVETSQRGRGLARALQRFACRKLHQDGVRWLHGNIDPNNIASRRQAEAMGRTIWWEAVRFRPEGGE